MTAWQVEVHHGDPTASLLQPHQILIASEDALQYHVDPLMTVEVQCSSHECSPSRSVVLLECIIDRRSIVDTNGANGSGTLEAGHVQVSAWIFHALLLDDGAMVTMVIADLQTSGPASALLNQPRIHLSVVGKYPLSTISLRTSSSSALSSTSTAISDATVISRVEYLPESVRQGKINLTQVLQRQLPRMFALKMMRCHQLLPIQLLQETYVFRIEFIYYGEQVKQEECSPFPIVYVIGWSDVAGDDGKDEESEMTLESQMAALHLNNAMQIPNEQKQHFMEELDQRLWQQGFAGYAGFIQELLLNIALVLKRLPTTSSTTHMDMIGSQGILISGVDGVGKTMALDVTQTEIVRKKIPTCRLDGMTLLMESETSQLSSSYEFLVNQLQRKFPGFSMQRDGDSGLIAGVVLIDDIDVLFQSPTGANTDDDDRGDVLPPLASSMLRLLDSINGTTRLCIVGTTSSMSTNIPAPAKRVGRFGKIMELLVPTEAIRCEILARHMSVLSVDAATESEISPMVIKRYNSLGLARARKFPAAWNFATRLAALTGGYVAKDLVRICRNAAVLANTHSNNAASTSPSGISWHHFLAAQQQIKPSQLRELNVASPGIQKQEYDFAGYTNVQNQLLDFVSWKFCPTPAMNRLGISNASGVLLHGPSGCGKSLLVKVLAAQAQTNFVMVKSSDLMSSYFGDSEKAVRQLFARARAASPCILFFDEFDAIAHKRSFDGADGGGGDSGGGVYARILSTFLNEMDGVGAQKSVSSSGTGEILVIAATNRLEALDAALVRPGRIDKMIEIGIPTQVDREEILAHYTRKMPLAADVDIRALTMRSTGNRAFTGADIAAICKEAGLRALREDTNANIVRMHHFEVAWDQYSQSLIKQSS